MTFPLNEMYGYSRLCDRLRSSAIIWKQVSLRSSAIYDLRSAIVCDRNQPLENKRITRVMSLERVGKVGGSSRSDTDGHDPSLRTPTRLAGSPMARDLENKLITRVMSLQRVGKVGGSSRSDTNGHDPSLRIPD